MGNKRVRWTKTREAGCYSYLRRMALFNHDPGDAVGRDHCCQRMGEAVDYRCGQHPDPFECPDCLIYYEPRFDEYGIIVHDGGSSFALIDFCPFCGAKLPESKRGLWIEKLETLGFKDPWTDDIPEPFRTDQWFRSGNQRVGS